MYVAAYGNFRNTQFAKVTAGLRWAPLIPEVYTPSMTPVLSLCETCSLMKLTSHPKVAYQGPNPMRWIGRIPSRRHSAPLVPRHHHQT